MRLAPYPGVSPAARWTLGPGEFADIAEAEPKAAQVSATMDKHMVLVTVTITLGGVTLAQGSARKMGAAFRKALARLHAADVEIVSTLS